MNLRDELIEQVSGIIESHRVLEPGSSFMASCDRCRCGWVRESVMNPGTYRWHVAAAVVDCITALGWLGKEHE